MASVLTPRATALTQSQLDAVTVIERVGSVFSLLGCVFIISTFLFSNAFHKPINRLVFYASFGNMMTNIGTLMARTYLPWPNSVGCQLQAFLIQMFMPADAFWTLSMAFNVYLTFYHKYDAQRLRKMEVPYLICCYGIPFVPAFVYIFVSNSEGARVYGNAVDWCWVSSEWDIWRILTFYGPIWIVILVTFFIYIRAGSEIYRKRKQLRNFSSADPEPGFAPDSNGSSKTTEIFVTSEAADIALKPVGTIPPRRDSESASRAPGAYSVTISSKKCRRLQSDGDITLPIQTNVSILPATTTIRANADCRHNDELNNAAWSYTKCAILFFTAILITWIPSSANRFYSLIHADEVSVPLQFMSSLVLPLQGFWNAIIYIVISWKAVRGIFANFSVPRRSGGQELVGNFRQEQSSFKHNVKAKNYSSESMAELANSGPIFDERR